MEERRKALEERTARLKKRNAVREVVNQALCLDPAWWGESESDSDDIDEGEIDEEIYVSPELLREVFSIPLFVADSSERSRVDASFLSRVATRNIPFPHNALPNHCS